ncbi:MAG: plastocyanin/azurin family copper-binding protein [Candidatus Micrarchaeia archaeon]
MGGHPAVLLALFLSGCPQYAQPAQPAAPAPNATPSTPQQPATAITHTVEITSSGFSPSLLTINAGDTVVFINRDSAPHWPASAVHPTHAAYPEPGGCIGSRFDACKPLGQGESFSFTFNRKGSWAYHDHLNLGATGTVVVQ